MGLWLKCPGCQTKNPLSLRACAKCGQSLDNLPKEARVYVIGPLEAVAPAPPAAHPAPRAEAPHPVVTAPAAAAPAAPKPAKQTRKPRKKKG